jgi:hypothetical protein
MKLAIIHFIISILIILLFSLQQLCITTNDVYSFLGSYILYIFHKYYRKYSI